MTEPASLLESIVGTMCMGILFILSIVLIVLFSLRWRFVKTEWLQVTGFIILGICMLFVWFTQWIYLDSLWSISRYRIVVPLWLPFLALGTQVVITIIGRYIGTKSRYTSEMHPERDRGEETVVNE